MGDLFYDAVGGLGVVCVLVAYLMLQAGKWRSTGMIYLALNLAGSVFVMLSLTNQWNLPAFILQCAWGAISVYGMVKVLRNR